MTQFEDGTYTPFDFVTVETSVVIPLQAYKLKDSSDVNSTARYIAAFADNSYSWLFPFGQNISYIWLIMTM